MFSEGGDAIFIYTGSPPGSLEYTNIFFVCIVFRTLTYFLRARPLFFFFFFFERN